MWVWNDLTHTQHRQVTPALLGPAMSQKPFEVLGTIDGRLVLQTDVPWSTQKARLIIDDLEAESAAFKDALSVLSPTQYFRSEMKAFLASPAFRDLPELVGTRPGFHPGQTPAWGGLGHPQFFPTDPLLFDEWHLVSQRHDSAAAWFALEESQGRWGEVMFAMRHAFTQPIDTEHANLVVNAVGTPDSQRFFAALLFAAAGEFVGQDFETLTLEDVSVPVQGLTDRERAAKEARAYGWALPYRYTRHSKAWAQRFLEWSTTPASHRRVVLSSKEVVARDRPGRAGKATWEKASQKASTWHLPPPPQNAAAFFEQMANQCALADPRFLA